MDFTYDDEQTALRDAVRGLLGRRTPTSRTAADGRRGPRLRRGALGPARRDGRPRAAVRRGGRRHGRRPGRGRHRGRGARPGARARAVPHVRSCWPAASSPPPAPTSSAPSVLGGAGRGRARARRSPTPSPAPGWAPTPRPSRPPQDGDAWTLTGVKEPVPHGARADLLVVSAALPDGGTGLFLVDLAATATGRRAPATPTHDGGRAARVAFDAHARRAARRAAARPRPRRSRRARRSPGSPRPTRRSGAMQFALAADHGRTSRAASSSASRSTPSRR